MKMKKEIKTKTHRDKMKEGKFMKLILDIISLLKTKYSIKFEYISKKSKDINETSLRFDMDI